MRKKFIIILLFLISLSSIMFVNLSIKTVADECHDCNQISTEPGDADYCGMSSDCDCQGAEPTIVTSSDVIEAGGSITLHVDSGGLACPCYTWSVSPSSKYSLDKTKTNNDLEEVTLMAASGSCGSGYTSSTINATVTVTDNCGESQQIVIRNTGGGWSSWVGFCGPPDSQYAIEAALPVGKYKYRFRTGYFTCDLSEAWECDQYYPGSDCRDYIDAASSLGFPAANGDTFTCGGQGAGCSHSGPTKIIVKVNGVDQMTRRFGIERSTWTCP